MVMSLIEIPQLREPELIKRCVTIFLSLYANKEYIFFSLKIQALTTFSNSIYFPPGVLVLNVKKTNTDYV